MYRLEFPNDTLTWGQPKDAYYPSEEESLLLFHSHAFQSRAAWRTLSYSERKIPSYRSETVFCDLQ